MRRIKMKFSTIVCDPPWAADDLLKMSNVKRGAASNYPVISVDDLCALPVKDLADPEGCVLALWVLGSMLEEGMRVMKAYGFQQKQTFVFVKNKKEDSIKKILKNKITDYIGSLLGDDILGFGLGRLFRQTHEICLIGINNTKIYKQLENKSQRSVCFAENQGHSIKPEVLQDRLELMFPNPNSKKLEIFARRKRPNWVCIGNEISNEDITVSIEKLQNLK
jgi:N6-adenosine-specific RNA methylase IME4